MSDTTTEERKQMREILNKKLPFGENTYMGECRENVYLAMQAHTAQRLSELKEKVEKLDKGDRLEGLVFKEHVLQLIEDQTNE